jgi:hypothetical protein
VPQPFLSISESAVPNCADVLVKGGGFQPGETVYIEFQWGHVGPLSKMDNVVAGPDGDFGPVRVQVKQRPNMAGNGYDIVALGATGGQASQDITIVAS